MLQAHWRSQLHQLGSLRDYEEQTPPADSAWHTARERKKLYSATEIQRLLLQNNLTYLADTSLFKKKERTESSHPTSVF